MLLSPSSRSRLGNPRPGTAPRTSSCLDRFHLKLVWILGPLPDVTTDGRWHNARRRGSNIRRILREHANKERFLRRRCNRLLLLLFNCRLRRVFSDCPPLQLHLELLSDAVLISPGVSVFVERTLIFVVHSHPSEYADVHLSTPSNFGMLSCISFGGSWRCLQMTLDCRNTSVPS